MAIFGVVIIGTLLALGTCSPAFAAQTVDTWRIESAVPATPAFAPTNPGQNGYLEYSLSPQQNINDSVLIRNPGNSVATFTVYPTDAMTSSATGVIYGGLGEPLKATGEWIHLPSRQVALKPGEAKTLSFSVDVPNDALPGDYVAGLSAENLPTTHDSQNKPGVGVSLEVNTRVVIAMVIHISGISPLTIQPGSPALVTQNASQQVVMLPLNDTGGRLAKPKLTASINHCAPGPTLATLNRQLDTFVPRTAIAYAWPLGQLVLPEGCYRITVAIINQGSVLSTKSADITVTPAQASVTPPPLVGSVTHSFLKSATPSKTNFMAASAGIGIAAISIGLLLAFVSRSRRKQRQLELELAQLKINQSD